MLNIMKIQKLNAAICSAVVRGKEVGMKHNEVIGIKALPDMGQLSVSMITARAFAMYVGLGNMEIGPLVILFYQFADIIFKLKKGDNENAMRHFYRIFSNRQKQGEKYVSPFGGMYVDEHGVRCMNIKASEIEGIADAVANMEHTAENVMAVCLDMLAVGRLYTEITIDAAKNGTKVVIWNKDKLEETKLVFCKFETVIKTDWKNSKAEASDFSGNKEFRFFSKKDETYRYRHIVEDMYNEAVKTARAEYLPVFNSAVAIKSEMPLELASEAVRIAREPANAFAYHVILHMKNTYLSLNNAKAQERAMIEDEFSSKESKRDKVKALNNRFKSFFAELGNMIRRATYQMDPVQRAKMVLGVTILEKDTSNVDGVGEFSNILMSALPEEMLLMVAEANCAAGLNKVTSNAKFIGNFSDGEMVAIKNCRYESEGRSITANVPDADYTVVVKDGRMYLETNMRNVVKVPQITPTLLVVSKDTISEAAYVRRSMTAAVPGTKVHLTYLRNSALKVSDAMVLDNGIVVFRYRGAAKGINSKGENPLNKVYNGKSGTIKDAILIDTGKTLTGLVILENVEKSKFQFTEEQARSYLKLSSRIKEEYDTEHNLFCRPVTSAPKNAFLR